MRPYEIQIQQGCYFFDECQALRGDYVKYKYFYTAVILTVQIFSTMRYYRYKIVEAFF